MQFFLLQQEMDDYHTVYVDIAEANERGNENEMPWKLEYSAKAAYGLEDMSAASWSDFANRMQSDRTLFQTYWRHYAVSIDDEEEPCGNQCRRSRVCELYEGLSYTPEDWCDQFYPKIELPQSNAECSARFIKRP